MRAYDMTPVTDKIFLCTSWPFSPSHLEYMSNSARKPPFRIDQIWLCTDSEAVSIEESDAFFRYRWTTIPLDEIPEGPAAATAGVCRLYSGQLLLCASLHAPITPIVELLLLFQTPTWNVQDATYISGSSGDMFKRTSLSPRSPPASFLSPYPYICFVVSAIPNENISKSSNRPDLNKSHRLLRRCCMRVLTLDTCPNGNDRPEEPFVWSFSLGADGRLHAFDEEPQLATLDLR
ncbi:hypothetical protein EDB86DRAFT_2007770 [Lactarius hatsudake]|nr:hypothetical protein EDB86DRAFT_2007770 [Lactarius hatsudake]